MQYRTNKYGKRHPITPKKAAISSDTFNDLRSQNENRKRIHLIPNDTQKQNGILDRLKPDKLEITFEPKNAYLPSGKATWKP